MLLGSSNLGFLISATASLLLGCGSGDAGGTNGTADGSAPNQNSSGGTSGASSGTGSTGSLSFVDEAGATGTEGETCAKGEAKAELTPIYLVFIYDTSQSMGDATYTDANGNQTQVLNAASRWTPMKDGMIAFFNAPASNNVHASLAYFPAPGNFDTTCQVSQYSTPSVSLTPLSTPDALIDSLNNRTTSGGTPTLPALRGAVQYALELKTQNSHAHVAVVLVTDGEPAVVPAGAVDADPNCPADDSLQNTVEGVAAVARAAYSGNPSIPVHVIGVGDSLSSLETIAAAGGTPVTLISLDNPAETTQSLLRKLEEIQVQQFSCDMAIPVTDGVDIDPGKVNIDFVHGDGSVEPFAKDDACASGTGWDYDDDANPTTVRLCANTCTSIQSDPAGHIRTVFGCPTRVR